MDRLWQQLHWASRPTRPLALWIPRCGPAQVFLNNNLLALTDSALGDIWLEVPPNLWQPRNRLEIHLEGPGNAPSLFPKSFGRGLPDGAWLFSPSDTADTSLPQRKVPASWRPVAATRKRLAQADTTLIFLTLDPTTGRQLWPAKSVSDIDYLGAIGVKNLYAPAGVGLAAEIAAQNLGIQFAHRPGRVAALYAPWEHPGLQHLPVWTQPDGTTAGKVGAYALLSKQRVSPPRWGYGLVVGLVLGLLVLWRLLTPETFGEVMLGPLAWAKVVPRLRLESGMPTPALVLAGSGWALCVAFLGLQYHWLAPLAPGQWAAPAAVVFSQLPWVVNLLLLWLTIVLVLVGSIGLVELAARLVGSRLRGRVILDAALHGGGALPYLLAGTGIVLALRDFASPLGQQQLAAAGILLTGVGWLAVLLAGVNARPLGKLLLAALVFAAVWALFG